MKYYVIDDERAKSREAFVIAEDEELSSYSYWFTVAVFNNRKEAEEFCDKYNSYDGCDDIELDCCSDGCIMSAYDYYHSSGRCAYEGT